MNETERATFLNALFTKNKALYGNLRMEVEEGDKPEEKSTPDEEKKDEPEGDGKSEGDKPEEKKKDGIDALPEWAQSELRNVRAEAANYRTRLREAEQKLADATSPEEIQTAITELREQNAKLERTVLVSKVARKHGLPDDLAARLTGDDEAALEADAKVLSKYVTAPNDPENLEGGLNPQSKDDGENDPRKLARKTRRF